MEEDRRTNTLEALLSGVGEIKGHLTAQQSSIHDLNKTILRQNGRIGKLEQWRNGIVVAIAIGAFTISVFGGRVWDGFQNNRWKVSDQNVYANKINDRLEKLEGAH